jgi:GNAT superfamily N-acetyltransferase
VSAVFDCPPPSELERDEPDAHLALEQRASCSLWWGHTPEHDGRRVGAIGHFRAADADSGAILLAAACARLAARGCRLAIGPMDGNTWRAYRAVIERGEEPPFFLEPDTPAHWPECFERGGFTAAATYCSRLQEHAGFEDRGLTLIERRAAQAGIRVRHLELARAERDLCDMHEVVHAAFTGAFLFSPIARDEFLIQYTRVLPHVRPELVLIAERSGTPLAFAFAAPDVFDASGATAILKTVATRPGFAHAGLGHLLVARCARAAAALGYRRAVHALMHEANSSSAWSARYGRVFRRYALFGRRL